jgi:hypothetical protein
MPKKQNIFWVTIIYQVFWSSNILDVWYTSSWWSLYNRLIFLIKLVGLMHVGRKKKIIACDVSIKCPQV